MSRRVGSEKKSVLFSLTNEYTLDDVRLEPDQTGAK